MRDQEQFLQVLDRDEAERRFRAVLDLAPRGIERVDLESALGRVLAADVQSPVDVPSFDRSNVDGYAVVAEDTFGASEEVPLTVRLGAEEIHTGVVPAAKPSLSSPTMTKPSARVVEESTDAPPTESGSTSVPVSFAADASAAGASTSLTRA